MNRTDAESLFKLVFKKLSLGMAIFTTSLDLTAISIDPAINRIMMMGNKKVERIKVFFLTLVRYSLFIMREILLIEFS
jgi:hypothetical protein